ncbi:hypothetical protein HCN44_000633 [Aphidius gifuensis]|uniref:Uncharacterized protein n=1 Tax=Aphidius gifuensis TaxID=684658 RepID=A0A835CR30_APHGI|nr:rap1 GTPase-GDP dissociation stimulator 1-B [Aphidius gifuensis]KAF7990828.1 hypothetical protein HCN44_000633 [Aphidius gifuensis]
MEGVQMVDIDKLIDNLQEVLKLQDVNNDPTNEIEIIKILDLLVDNTNDFDKDEFKLNIDYVFLTLLTNGTNKIISKTARAIAEISKCEKGRMKFTNKILIDNLMNQLMKNDVEILTQVSRALGNICYENEQGKKMVQEADGLKCIIDVIKKSLKLEVTESSEILKNVSVGFLLNYLADQKDIKQSIVDEEIIPIIYNILEVDAKNGKKSATHALLILESLNESGLEFFNDKLIKILADILENDTSTELSELSLELLHSQAENDKIQIMLAKAGVCKVLVNLLEKHIEKCKDEEARTLLKIACNLIVIIITGDESMNLLYDNSNGLIYKKMISWLDNNTDDDLKVTAVLSMGNFARTDAHCQLMVSQGVHKLLINLLKNNNNSDGDIRLQHALLSAIRNLVIPIKNKSIMINDGLIDVVYPMIEIQTFPVVFKLLGTLRIVIDGQENVAIELGTKNDLIEKTIKWCNSEDHAGVQGEANRLLAWLIINSKNQNVISLMIKQGALEYLIKMITAAYPIMQNEALLSLAIMTAVNLSDCQNDLIQADVAGQLVKFIQNSNDNNLEEPIIENAITFITTIIKSDLLKDHIKQSKLSSCLNDYTNSLLQSSQLKDKIIKLCNLIED